jgi:hypothetical protein
MFPEKPYNKEMARSQISGGKELDECCGDISTAADLSSMAGGSMDQAEGGKGLGALRGMSIKNELETAKRVGKYYEPTKFTTEKH